MMVRILLFALFWASSAVVAMAQVRTISGYVYDDANGESLIGVTVHSPGSNVGTTTNEYGFYSISLENGAKPLVFTYLGYENAAPPMPKAENAALNVRLRGAENVIKGVTISARAEEAKEAVMSSEMGKMRIPIEVLRKTPVLFGESDIIKAIQLLPGVKRGGEGGIGMYVRGGGNDENLILLDEATVYNVGHALGFLSVFNSNAIKSVDMYKGAFPAQFGGRLSSIMDVRMREGSDQGVHAQGSIGNIASSLTVEAPIVKGRGSFILSGRRSYIDRLIKWTAGKNVLPYYFYDFNAKANYKLNDRDRLYVSTYVGRDILSAAPKADSIDLDLGFATNLGNFTVTARWNHIYPSQKLFHNVTLIRSQFRYKVEGEAFGNSLFIRSAIDDIGVKTDYDYRPNSHRNIKFGGQMLNHLFRPNLISLQGDISDLLKGRELRKIYNQEFALFGNIDEEISPKWRLNGGLRLSGSAVAERFYANLEPRFSARFAVNDQHSFKMGYARMAQYLHLVSSSAIALPTDLWYPSTKNVAPGKSDQISAGYFTYFGKGKKTVQASVEGYFKRMTGQIEYREGARLILNDNYEEELVRGAGRAYGAEALLQKNSGRLTGWVGYTLSWATRKFPELNNGKRYYARFDRRHDVAVVMNFDLARRMAISGAWVFSGGSPFTPIVGKYLQPYPNLSGVDLLPVYPGRNSYRLNDTHRLDLDFVLKSKPRKHHNHEFHMGAYNFYNRAQPNRVVVKFDKETGKERYEERGLFGFILSVSYNFKF